MSNNTQNLKIIFLVSALTLGIESQALADIASNDFLDAIRNNYRDTSSAWAATLTNYATRLFYILAAIDITWMAIGLALRPGEFADWAANLVRKVLFLGFFWMLLQPVGGVARGISWAQSIVSSLVIAGDTVSMASGGVPLSPSDIFDTGFTICSAIFAEISIFDPVDGTALIIGAILIMIAYALIAAMMLLVYVQSYVLIYAGVLLLGFGGSVFTKDIAINYFKAALAVGAKLFVMTLIVGIGKTIVDGWVTTITIELEQVVLFIGSSVVLLALVKEVPNMVGDLINGFSIGAGDTLAASTMRLGKGAMAATAGAVVGGVGGAMAVKEAANLAKSDGARGFIGITKGVATHLASTATADTAGRLSGKLENMHGTKGARMAASMKTDRLSQTNHEPYISPASGANQENNED